MADRIYGEAVDINPASVQGFYEKRAANINAGNPYSAVLLSDHSPELVREQISIEDEKILPRLKIGRETKVLDIGCGIGRWAEKAIPLCEYYYGIDFSRNMTDAAKGRAARFDKSNYAFERLSFQEFTSKPPGDKYNLVIISGILVYICDGDIKAGLAKLPAFLEDKCRIFIWEPCGIGQRLTMKDFPSEALKDNYNAIYRTKDEYDAFLQPLTGAGFSATFCEYYSSLGGTVTYGDTDKIYYILER
jgi:SAM-dependent methyltransferase